MATNVVAGADMKRTDLFLVNPFEVEVQEALRGRISPPTEEVLIELAESIFDYGQRQSVECRRIAGNRLQLTMGYTRMAAIRLIRDGFVGNDGVERHDPNFKIKTTVADANDEEALTRNVIENRHRNATTPIDDAVNQNILRDRYGKSDDEIAKLFHVSIQTVERTALLLRLEARERDLVHQGLMTVTAALDLLELPAEKRAEVIEAATAETGKVQGAKVRSQVRDHHLNDDKGGNRDPNNAGPKPATVRKKAGDGVAKEGIEVPADGVEREATLGEEGAPAAKPAKKGGAAPAAAVARLKPLTVKEIKDYLNTEGIQDTGGRAKLCRLLKKWVEGARTNEEMSITLQKVFGEIKTETEGETQS